MQRVDRQTKTPHYGNALDPGTVFATHYLERYRRGQEATKQITKTMNGIFFVADSGLQAL